VYSPQLSQIWAGTGLMTTSVSPHVKETVTWPGTIRPVLQAMQFIGFIMVTVTVIPRFGGRVRNCV